MKWINLNTRYISVTYVPVFFSEICSFVKYATFADFLPNKNLHCNQLVKFSENLLLSLDGPLYARLG